MALVVEDGTAKTDAESYVSVADADTYFSNRGNAAWAALTTEQKEQALRKATDYLVAVYRLRWKGRRVSQDQALDWPRYDAYIITDPFHTSGILADDWLIAADVVPVEVERACAELAVRAAGDTLIEDLDLTDARGSVVKQKAGSVEIQYKSDHELSNVKKFPLVERLLDPLIEGENASRYGGTIEVTRA